MLFRSTRDTRILWLHGGAPLPRRTALQPRGQGLSFASQAGILNALKKEPLPTKAGSTKNDCLTASRVARSLGDVSESGYDRRLGIKLVDSGSRSGVVVSAVATTDRGCSHPTEQSIAFLGIGRLCGPRSERGDDPQSANNRQSSQSGASVKPAPQ